MSKVPFDEFEVRELSPDAKHWRNSFDSRFLRHFWLNGQPRIVTLARVQELLSKNSRSGETKIQVLITLAEAEKPWACNVTNCGLIEELYNEPDHSKWVGRRLELYPTKTRGPTGAMVDCMRVRPERPKAAQSSAAATKRRPEVNAYTARMKAAATDDDLSLIADAITEDNDLSADETQYLIEMLRKRRGQIDAEEAKRAAGPAPE